MCSLGERENAEKRQNTNPVRLWQPISRLKVKTCKSLSKKKEFKAANEKLQMVVADLDLFGHIIITANSRNVNLREVQSLLFLTVLLILRARWENQRKVPC